jgi:hypothetical protein
VFIVTVLKLGANAAIVVVLKEDNSSSLAAINVGT